MRSHGPESSPSGPHEPPSSRSPRLRKRGGAQRLTPRTSLADDGCASLCLQIPSALPLHSFATVGHEGKVLPTRPVTNIAGHFPKNCRADVR
ncbi:hypothetical protein WJX84_009315 [Apatococcus fuscideae]|uniref:Uncharacterized protein n=1 Tax=Apatococcus fuscideae TaxID=2026836 RepID=A0AAW1SHE6_9CHLO